MYVKNTAFKQCQTYMVFYLYKNLPNKLTYSKETKTKNLDSLLWQRKMLQMFKIYKNDI
jgi:hypothetical protein